MKKWKTKHYCPFCYLHTYTWAGSSESKVFSPAGSPPGSPAPEPPPARALPGAGGLFKFSFTFLHNSSSLSALGSWVITSDKWIIKTPRYRIFQTHKQTKLHRPASRRTFSYCSSWTWGQTPCRWYRRARLWTRRRQGRWWGRPRGWDGINIMIAENPKQTSIVPVPRSFHWRCISWSSACSTDNIPFLE